MSPISIIINGYHIYQGANLKNADLRNGDLSNLNLSRCDLTDADLRGANLENIIIDLNTKFNNVQCNPEQLKQINAARQRALQSEGEKEFVSNQYFNLTITNFLQLKTLTEILTEIQLPKDMVNYISFYFMFVSFPIKQIESMGYILRNMDKFINVVNNDTFWRKTKTKYQEFFGISVPPVTLFPPIFIQKKQDKLKNLAAQSSIIKFNALLEAEEIPVSEDKPYFTGHDFDPKVDAFLESLHGKEPIQKFLDEYPEAEEKPGNCFIQ